jgi:8-oxo-dGTP pyrophosphatase MutT (NUDIX family)
MTEPPDALPVIERNAVRIVLLDTHAHVLLLHIRDLASPQFGVAWELPGGGMEPGETFAQAVSREVREETGLCIDPDLVGQPTWRRDVSYPYRGVRRLQHEAIAVVRLETTAPEIEGSQRVDFEQEDLFGFRWWTVDEIVRSTECFYPRSLPKLLPRFLAGEEIDEAFELWP